MWHNPNTRSYGGARTHPQRTATCPHPGTRPSTRETALVHARGALLHARAHEHEIATSSGEPTKPTTTSCVLGLTLAHPQAYPCGSRRSTPARPRWPLRRPNPPAPRPPRACPPRSAGQWSVAATSVGPVAWPDRCPSQATPDTRNTANGGGTGEMARAISESGPGHGRRPDGDREDPEGGHSRPQPPDPRGPLRRQLRRHGRQGPPDQGPDLRAPLDHARASTPTTRSPGRPGPPRSATSPASSSSSRRTSRSRTSGASSRRTSSSASTSAATSARRSARRASAS